MSAAPAPVTDTTATPELDNAVHLPAENRRSYWAMIAVQALNAFNDNFVKILLVAFAGVVAAGGVVTGALGPGTVNREGVMPPGELRLI